MSAMYKTSIWKFSNPAVRSTYDAMLSPVNADSFVTQQSQDHSTNGFADPIAKSVGQSFSIAFSEELHSRGLVAERIAIQSVIGTEKLRDGRSRRRLELDVIAGVPRATQNELIDALAAAKRKCSAAIGGDLKILLRAELKMDRMAVSDPAKWLPAKIVTARA